MSRLQEVYNRIAESKKKMKEAKKMLQEQYEQSSEYLEHTEKIKAISAKRKIIKEAINAQNPSIVATIDDLKIDIASDKELLSDLILKSTVEGQKVELQDEYQQQILPIFSVKFTKV